MIFKRLRKHYIAIAFFQILGIKFSLIDELNILVNKLLFETFLCDSIFSKASSGSSGSSNSFIVSNTSFSDLVKQMVISIFGTIFYHS